MQMKEDAQQRFWTHVDVQGPDECWPWRQSRGSHGYGQTWTGMAVVLAHRMAYALTRSLPVSGQLKHTTTVDHSCHNRSCCNPSHLRLKSNVDNATDNGFASRTHCPAGHGYTEDNTYISPNGDRRCRECDRQRRGGLHPVSSRTHCQRGHPFDETNTYITPAGHRRCRACVALRVGRQSRTAA